ncbi:hypothetical protein [Simonsiella muelleri]|uniref:hypothetical protein n=1 Tax=Simonsiella muelleri TaxID=72 RepID=UPI0028D63F9C|nr:hypothetical protein [Simonsiella muelleri]
MSKTYHQAPLPFTGQKRNFLKAFKQVLNEQISGDGDGWTIIDVFGGSGLLAHTAKRCKPAARVIYNDFDGYATCLQHIDDTNRLRRILFDLLKDYPRKTKLTPALKAVVQSTLQTFGGYVDVASVASWILFSGQQARTLDDLMQHGFYNRVRLSDYDSADGYLDGLEIVSQSYADLLPQFEGQDNVLLLLDPPYVCTVQGAYYNDVYFGMVEFLKLMSVVRPPFVFFSSTRSEFLDYLDLVIGYKLDGWERFAGYRKVDLMSVISYASKYEDNMVYKF